MGNNFSRNESHNIYKTYDSRFINTQSAKKTGALASPLKKEVEIDENVSAKLKFLLSGTFYGKLRQNISIKDLMKAEDFNDCCFELLVELKREIEDNNEHSSLSGLVSSNLIAIIKEILDYVNENILKKKYSFDQNEIKVQTLMFCIFKKLIELFHILKFLKEDGLFLEGKWWNPLSDQKKLEKLQKTVHIIVDKFITHENLEEEAEEEEEEEEQNDNNDEVLPLPPALHSLTSSNGHVVLSPPPHSTFSIPPSSSLPLEPSHPPISTNSPPSSPHPFLSSPLPILSSSAVAPPPSSFSPLSPSSSFAPPLSSSSPSSPPKEKNNPPRKKSLFSQARKDSVKLDSESLKKSIGNEEGVKKEEENGRREEEEGRRKDEDGGRQEEKEEGEKKKDRGEVVAMSVEDLKRKEENSRKGEFGKKMIFSFETVEMKKSDSAQLIFRKNIEIWANETSQSLKELLELFQARKIALKLGDEELFTNENEILTEFENKLLFFKKEFSSISERNLGPTENNEVFEGLFKEFTSFKESILKNYEERINQKEEENLSLNNLNESAISSSAIRKSLEELKKSIEIEKSSILNPIELRKSIDSLRESLRESVELLNFQSIVRRVE